MSDPKDVIYEQLLRKISSKHQTNSILLGFTATMLAVVTAEIYGQDHIDLSTFLSMLFMLCAVHFFFYGLWSFDRLTTPKALWLNKSGEELLKDEDARRVSESDIHMLSTAMIRYWYLVTTPGLVALVLALILFLSFSLLGPIKVKTLFLPPVILGASLFLLLYFALVHRSLKADNSDIMRHQD